MCMQTRNFLQKIIVSITLIQLAQASYYVFLCLILKQDFFAHFLALNLKVLFPMKSVRKCYIDSYNAYMFEIMCTGGLTINSSIIL